MTRTTHRSHRVSLAHTLVAGLALLGGLMACSDDDDTITGPVVGVTAVRDSTFNFAPLRTFAMPDTVVQFSALTGTPIAPSRQFDHVALDRVRQNLIGRGYKEVVSSKQVRPDFIVMVSSTATTNYDAWVTYPWYSSWGFYSGWSYYDAGFSNSWSLVYPWYPVVGVTAYDRGTLVVTMLPTLSVNPLNQTVNASWAGLASALLNGTVTANTVNASIDEMFRLSPYLVAAP